MDEVLFYFHQGNGFFLEGEYGQAIQSYTRCIKLFPSEPNIYAARAICYLMNNQYKRMRADAEILINQFQAIDMGCYFKGISFLAEKNIQNAELLFQKVLEISPNNQLARNQLATIGMMKHPINLPELFELFKDKPDELDFQLLPLINQIQNNPLDLLNFIGNPGIVISLRKACDFNYRLPQVDYRSNHFINRFRSRQSTFSKYIQFGGNNTNDQIERRVDLVLFSIEKSKEFLKSKQYSYAYDFAKRALSNCTSSTSPEVVYIVFKCMHISLLGLGQIHGALSAYQNAFQASNIRYTQEVKSHCRFLQRLSKNCKDENPEHLNPHVRFDIYLTMFNYSKNRSKVLKRRSNSSTVMNPSDFTKQNKQEDDQKMTPQRFREEADACLQNNNFEGAAKWYSKAIFLCSTDPTLFTCRASAYLGLNLPDSAIQDCQSALQLDPNCILALLKMGRVYLMKQNNKARECARKIFMIDEDNADAILLLKQAGLIPKEKSLQADTNVDIPPPPVDDENDMCMAPFSMPIKPGGKSKVQISLKPNSDVNGPPQSLLKFTSKKH